MRDTRLLTGPFFMPSNTILTAQTRDRDGNRPMSGTETKTASTQPAAGTQMTGAEIVLQALRDNGVEHIFGYPGGAVLPIYDEIHQQDDIQHILVRHEQ